MTISNFLRISLGSYSFSAAFSIATVRFKKSCLSWMWSWMIKTRSATVYVKSISCPSDPTMSSLSTESYFRFNSADGCQYSLITLIISNSVVFIIAASAELLYFFSLFSEARNENTYWFSFVRCSRCCCSFVILLVSSLFSSSKIDSRLPFPSGVQCRWLLFNTGWELL